MSSLTEAEKPFRVVIIGGKISDMLAGYDTEDEALARCAFANAVAEQLNIKARYEVRKKKA